MIAGNHIISPADGSKVSPTEYIVFDAPLGRAHCDTGRFIDFMVFIDTPLDVAMARRLLRAMTVAEAGAEDAIKIIEVELSSYLGGARMLYVEFQDRIKRDCELIVDGCLTLDELAGAIHAKIPQR